MAYQTVGGTFEIPPFPAKTLVRPHVVPTFRLRHKTAVHILFELIQGTGNFASCRAHETRGRISGELLNLRVRRFFLTFPRLRDRTLRLSKVIMGLLCRTLGFVLPPLRRGNLIRSLSRRMAERNVSDLGAREAQAEISRLADEIYRHDQLYYRDSAPEISDEDYDLLVQYANDLESRFPQFVPPHSRSRRVGYRDQLTAAEAGFPPVRHRTRMYSLDNAFGQEDIEAFVQRLRRVLPPAPADQGDWDLCFVAEPKIDGLSLSLAYQDGILLHAATRGDGTTGEMVTANALQIRGVPAELRAQPEERRPAFVEVRGEVFCPLEEFRVWSDSVEGDAPKSPRNVAAGSVRQQDARITGERPLQFCAYGAEFRGAQGQPQSHEALLKCLSRWGFKTSLDLLSPRNPATQLRTAEDMMEFASWIGNSRAVLDFPCDGVVFKLDDLELSSLAGFTARAPRSAIAYKFPSSKFTTVLLDVDVGVGRTGLLTPRAILEPVTIDGVSVSKATLHNFKILEALDLRIGDRISIERAGDVIPKIVGKLSSSQSSRTKIHVPEHCPSCSSPLQVRGREGRGGDRLACVFGPFSGHPVA
eukprot:scaffold1733_cov257-Pinguiococcus_pyrenoidosus.AAC.8